MSQRLARIVHHKRVVHVGACHLCHPNSVQSQVRFRAVLELDEILKFRNGNAQQKGYRVAPSEMRDAMCAALWRTVCDGDVGERAEIEARMQEGKEKRASELAL